MPDTNRVAKSIAEMVTEWVEGGIRGGTDWRNGLERVILKRLERFYPGEEIERAEDEYRRGAEADFQSHVQQLKRERDWE